MRVWKESTYVISQGLECIMSGEYLCSVPEVRQRSCEKEEEKRGLIYGLVNMYLNGLLHEYW